MIGRVLKRGKRVYGLLWYLYSPGKACVHSNPHVVSGWRHPADLEPPLRDDGKRDFRRLTGLLEQPLALLGDQAPASPVWHCTVRAAPGDPDLGDGAWMKIAAEIMDRTGLSRRGEEELGVRWVAVHHGENHIHIAATLARQDGRRARLDNDWYRIGEALRDIEKEYGLQVVERADRTAADRPTRPEQEKAARAGRAEPPRVTLQRQVAAAAAGARSEPEFFAALEKRGLRVRLRHSTHTPGQVTGYAVGLDGDLTADGRPIWYGGGKLAPDLSLPKLRRRWPEPGERTHRQHDAAAAGPRPRLSGRGMTAGPSRTVLRHEVTRCAAAARSEQQFFTGLDRAGLLVRLRHNPVQPARVTGYSVSLPGMTHWDGQQVWYGGQTLDVQLSLAALRARWQAGRPGTPPGPDVFAAAGTRDIFGYATTVAAGAARALRASPTAAQSADISWAAADVLTAAAQATGSPELQQAADGFSRAARASWGRIPPPTADGASLRTAAYLLAACTPRGTRRRIDRLALISALAGLAGAVAAAREAQNRLLQATAAHRAATALAAQGTAADPAEAPALFSAQELFGSPATGWPAPSRATRSRPSRRRAGPGPGPAP